ncbi:MAG: hypothetical protein HY704_01880 [Gemmatimonadetes bacterium]|nr:hypothetical protein [Gemmatimonadota bacterium]
MIPEGLWLAFFGAAASYTLTAVAIHVLPRVGLRSVPDPYHPEPVPVGGGIAIWITAALGALLIALRGEASGAVLFLFVGASALFVAGLWDDARQLEPRAKLFIQITAAAVIVATGTALFPLGRELEWLSVPLTILWFVGVCNAFNLIDNMDGMLPGVTAIAAAFVGLFAFATGRPEAGLLSWAVAGASAGFLRYNLPPARIFLGDSGSMFLGFLLAGLAIGDSWQGFAHLVFTILVPAMLLAVPIFNTTFVTVTRKLAGVSVVSGKADHINYRLLAHGLSRGRTLLAVYALSAAAGWLALLAITLAPLPYVVGVGLFLVVLAYLGVFLYQGRVHEFYEQFDVERRADGWEQSPWYRWVVRFLAMTGDVVLVFASLYVAFLLRFDGGIPRDQLANLARVLPFLIVLRVGIALVMGVYETQWRLGLARDAVRLIAAVAVGTVLFAAALFVMRLPSFPRTVIVIEGILSLIFFAFTRLGVRALGEVASSERGSRGKRTLIAGSQEVAVVVYRLLRARAGPAYHVIGFADDDPLAQRSLVGGVRVLGPVSALPELARRYEAEHVIVCVPGRVGNETGGVVQACLDAGLGVEVARLDIARAETWLAERGSVPLRLEAG